MLVGVLLLCIPPSPWVVWWFLYLTDCTVVLVVLGEVLMFTWWTGERREESNSTTLPSLRGRRFPNSHRPPPLSGLRSDISWGLKFGNNLENCISNTFKNILWQQKATEDIRSSLVVLFSLVMTLSICKLSVDSLHNKSLQMALCIFWSENCWICSNWFAIYPRSKRKCQER